MTLLEQPQMNVTHALAVLRQHELRRVLEIVARRAWWRGDEVAFRRAAGCWPLRKPVEAEVREAEQAVLWAVRNSAYRPIARRPKRPEVEERVAMDLALHRDLSLRAIEGRIGLSRETIRKTQAWKAARQASKAPPPQPRLDQRVPLELLGAVVAEKIATDEQRDAAWTWLLKKASPEERRRLLGFTPLERAGWADAAVRTMRAEAAERRGDPHVCHRSV